LSKSFATEASSGKPSMKFSVPNRVSTLSGETMPGGISVVISILGAVCASAVAAASVQTSAVARVFSVVIFMFLVSPFSCFVISSDS
jgi:multisubunit Na+/H+ antiporter MnhG subunit